MAIIIKGKVYYRTKEACERSGISRATFYRWLKEGIIDNPSNTDRNGWRLFTDKDIRRIRTEKEGTSVCYKRADALLA